MALIAHYPLNGDTKDYSGYGRHGTASNVTWDDGKIGKAGGFNGSVDIVLPRIPAFMPVGTFSISFWEKPAATQVNSRYYVYLSGRDKNNSGIGIYNGQFFVWIGGVMRALSYSRPVDKWSHVSCIYDSSVGMRVYVNGVLTSSNKYTGTIAYTQMHGTSPSIGSHGGIYRYTGQLNDFRFYDHALSDKEVKEIAKAKVLHYKFDEQDLTTQLVKDSSGFRNDGTVAVTTAPTWSEDSPVGRGSMEFDGSLIKTGKLFYNSEQTHTISAWVKPTNSNSNNQQLVNFHQGYRLFNTRNSRSLMYMNSGANDHYVYGSRLAENKWTLVTWVYDKSSLRCQVYYDGVLNASSSNFTAIDVPSGFSATTIFGTNFVGNISDVRIYATALSPEDILELYQTRASVDNEGNLFVQEIDERDFDIVGRSKTIRVAGSGYNSPNRGISGTYIDNVFHGYNSRGLNISVYDNALNRYASARFDTYANGSVAVDSYNNDFSSYTRTIGALAEVGAFLDLIPSGYIVAVTSSDSIWGSVNDVLSTSLERALGAEKIRLAKKSRDHYTLLAYKNNGRPLYEDYKDNLSTTLTEAFSKEFNTETKLYGNGVFKANEFIETGVVGASVNDGEVYVNEIMEV